ncbi:hypothetical protein GCK72_025369 [Caenorhabditis remanei]|uniref:Uncharacterized protein n=2 Tax=Caenorhabditis remanei TaxID=31234 RepID=E3MJR2_CAERE|nr:hypothetical protein GCK72_025369 [Caenorhabditis remanei]EFP03659.1 hypothetical protein CRE_19261 [Caenorhabditis remanei]KAF1748902.1 hypothetical protein GCK72_025369 [Caenorhabditis remanei]
MNSATSEEDRRIIARGLQDIEKFKKMLASFKEIHEVGTPEYEKINQQKRNYTSLQNGPKVPSIEIHNDDGEQMDYNSQEEPETKRFKTNSGGSTSN